jgi:glutathione peroxidase
MTRRRIFETGLLGVFVMTLALQAEDKKEPAKSEKAVPAVLNFKMKSLGGKEVDLSKYQGKVVLMVNVASKCGATPQYTPLQELHEKYKDQGFVVLGFPCNQFGAQEPGTATEIEEFCTENYGVTFDMFEKIDVNGEKAAPLYKYLTSKETNPDSAGKINWNFEKFLISRDGKIVSRFKTQISPDEPEVVKAIEAEIGKK